MQPGTQILHVPTHADNDLSHPDVECGFVTSIRGDVAFCRYWRKDLVDLRTKSCSEGIPIDLIVVQNSVTPEKVEAAMKWIQEETEKIMRQLEQLRRDYYEYSN